MFESKRSTNPSSNQAENSILPYLNEAVSPTPRLLRYSQISLASFKYSFSLLAAASFAVATLSQDQFFNWAGALLIGLAVAAASVQVALIQRKRWARWFAIGLAILQIPSLALPIAIVSLRGLLSKEVAFEFGSNRTVAPPSQVIAFKSHSLKIHVRPIAFASLVFIILVSAGLIKRELRTKQKQTSLVRSSYQDAQQNSAKK